MVDYEKVLDKFIVKSRTGNGEEAKCLCPSHGDKKASLSIKHDKANDKIVMFCHVGCETKDILQTVGLTFADLGTNCEKKESDPNIVAVYQYKNANKEVIFEKVRFKDKKFSQRRYIDNSIIWGLDYGEYSETFEGSNMYSKKNRPNAKKKICFEQRPILYNLPNLINAISNNHNVYICEGEKDCDTLNRLGLVATTGSNGAGPGKWLEEYCSYFRGANVIILPDNDEPGKNYGAEIENKLRKYAHKIKVITISDQQKGDITDYIKEGHTLDDFMQEVNKIEWTYAPWISINEKNKKQTVTQGVLIECIEDTLHYVTVGDISSNNPLIYVYENGVYKNISKNILKGIVAEYLSKELKTDNLTNAVANMLMTKQPVDYKTLQGDRDTINLKNGLYNVKTKILEPHTPGYISDFQLDINYMDNPSNNHIWDNFLNTLTEGDQEIKDFLQEWYGLILSNYDASIVKSFTYLYGKGDSGKSVPIKVLNALLTDKLFMALDVCKLGDRFSLGNVANKRLIACGDVVGRFIDESSLGMMKQLTGGDIISIEKKGKDPLSIHYRGLMMFSANHIPSFNGDLGRHVFERINIIPCNNVIPAEKRDKLFHEKILKEKDYIFKWALEGLERLINNEFRFTQSKKMNEAKEEFSIDIDSVRAFIRNNYDITENKKDRYKTKVVYDEYNNYCLEEELIPVSKKNFKLRLKNLNIGFTVYCGSDHYTNLKEKDLIEVKDEDSQF